MARQVCEIMNRELFAVAPDEDAGDVRGYLRSLGITGAPVVTRDGVAVGFVALRDIVDAPLDKPVGTCMSTPVDTISGAATVREAALAMARQGRHHLVVIDERSRAIGFVGSLDAIRALLGEPVPHPGTFPNYDKAVGLSWSSDYPLNADTVGHAPDGPGLFRLIRSRPDANDRIVWTEGTRNVRTRLLDLLAGPQPIMPHLIEELERREIRFRAASTKTEAELAQAVARLGAFTKQPASQ